MKALPSTILLTGLLVAATAGEAADAPVPDSTKPKGIDFTKGRE